MKISRSHVLDGGVLAEVVADPRELLFDSVSDDYCKRMVLWFMRDGAGNELEPKYYERFKRMVKIQNYTLIAVLGPIYMASNKRLPMTTEADVMRVFEDAMQEKWHPWSYMEMFRDLNIVWYKNVNLYWSRLNETSQCFVACLAKAIIDKLPTPLES